MDKFGGGGIDGFHGAFSGMETGGHYITMLPADWLVPTSQNRERKEPGDIGEKSCQLPASHSLCDQ